MSLSREERNRLISEHRESSIEKSCQVQVVLEDDELLTWQTKKGDKNYSLKIDGIKLYLTRDEGSRQTYGGKTLLGRHFLEKKQWQDLVRENFGSAIFEKVFLIMSSRYKERGEEFK